MSSLQEVQYEEIVDICGIGEVFDVIHLTPTEFDIETELPFCSKCLNKFIYKEKCVS